MTILVKKILGVAITVAVVVAAGFGARWLWIRYNLDPWTRDGRLRADVVQVSPDINGLVTAVDVRDGQEVRIGDTLFIVDRPRYELALAQADAAIAADEAQLAQARRESKRNKGLNDLVT